MLHNSYFRYFFNCSLKVRKIHGKLVRSISGENSMNDFLEDIRNIITILMKILPSEVKRISCPIVN